MGTGWDGNGKEVVGMGITILFPQTSSRLALVSNAATIFTARRSYTSAVLGVVILSVRPSVRLSHACFVTNPKNLPAIFLYHMKGQAWLVGDIPFHL